MCEANQTQITVIHLIGFHDPYKFKTLYFILFLLSYVVILIGNFLIIFLVSTAHQLKIPMFILLRHLSAADILLTTTVVSVILHGILSMEGTISFAGCFAQLFFFGVFGCVQIYLIAAMCYDRYLAICTPLRYASLMNFHTCFRLAFGSWSLSTLLLSSEMVVACQFQFCGRNSIDHFFCDFGPILELATSDKSSFIIQDMITSLFMLPLPLAFIVISYVCISITVLKISSNYGRRKAFSTCGSHLATVCTSYGTLITVYLVPRDQRGVNNNKYESLVYLVVSPLLNPIIYSLRNPEINKILRKMFRSIRSTS